VAFLHAHTKYKSYKGVLQDLAAAVPSGDYRGYYRSRKQNRKTAQLAALLKYEGPEDLIPPRLRGFDRDEAARAYKEVKRAPDLTGWLQEEQWEHEEEMLRE